MGLTTSTFRRAFETQLDEVSRRSTFARLRGVIRTSLRKSNSRAAMFPSQRASARPVRGQGSTIFLPLRLSYGETMVPENAPFFESSSIPSATRPGFLSPSTCSRVLNYMVKKGTRRFYRPRSYGFGPSISDEIFTSAGPACRHLFPRLSFLESRILNSVYGPAPPNSGSWMSKC